MALIDPELLKILACPADDHGALREGPAPAGSADIDGVLECTVCGRTFAVRDGIPVLLLDEAL
ncbi:Trm112 family protein [Epidermidibacterium keratini]|uniref:Trm112 family protein n=1 Tax=Epidermidibacterium keratini TaxID=1891644 RepID=A0A7L4YSP6_9ACTN|nr:Trm112 family protein [Epidermidibacterium keratini]QHC01557.1 Trm112 family protein [Epidermidibacterium keratini]